MSSACTTPSSRNASFSRLSPHLPPVKDGGEGGDEAEEAAASGSDKSISRKKRRSGETQNTALISRSTCSRVAYEKVPFQKEQAPK